MFNALIRFIRKTRDYFNGKPKPGPERKRAAVQDPDNIGWTMTVDMLEGFKRDGCMSVEVNMGPQKGQRIVVFDPSARLYRVPYWRLELQMVLGERVAINGDTDEPKVSNLVFRIPDEWLVPRFQTWRDQNAVCARVGAPATTYAIHLPCGVTLLGCQLVGNSLDLEGRAYLRCQGYTTTKKYEAENPDRFCLTRADGECESPDPRCMHNKHSADAAIERVVEAEVSMVEAVARAYGVVPDAASSPDQIAGAVAKREPDDEECKRCGSTPYHVTRCPSCGPNGRTDAGVVFLENPETDPRSPNKPLSPDQVVA